MWSFVAEVNSKSGALFYVNEQRLKYAHNNRGFEWTYKCNNHTSCSFEIKISQKDNGKYAVYKRGHHSLSLVKRETGINLEIRQKIDELVSYHIKNNRKTT